MVMTCIAEYLKVIYLIVFSLPDLTALTHCGIYELLSPFSLRPPKALNFIPHL